VVVLCGTRYLYFKEAKHPFSSWGELKLSAWTLDQENEFYMLNRKHTKSNRQKDVQDSIPAN
jgi:hypothetical protein